LVNSSKIKKVTVASMKKKSISQIEQAISKEQKKSIERGLRDITLKKTISHHKANKEIGKWLSKIVVIK